MPTVAFMASRHAEHCGSSRHRTDPPHPARAVVVVMVVKGYERGVVVVNVVPDTQVMVMPHTAARSTRIPTAAPSDP